MPAGDGSVPVLKGAMSSVNAALATNDSAKISAALSSASAALATFRAAASQSSDFKGSPGDAKLGAIITQMQGASAAHANPAPAAAHIGKAPKAPKAAAPTHVNETWAMPIGKPSSVPRRVDLQAAGRQIGEFLALGGPGSGPHPGASGGKSTEHDEGHAAAQDALGSAGKWFAGKGGTTHGDAAAAQRAAEGAHEHLISQGFVAGKSSPVFGNPGARTTEYSKPGGGDATIETGRQMGAGEGASHYMSVKAHK